MSEPDKEPEKPVKAKKPKRLSRADRWVDAVTRAIDALDELIELQQEYQDWFDNLPENLHSSPVGEKLQEVTDIDLESAKNTVDEAEGLDLPQGFGRD